MVRSALLRASPTMLRIAERTMKARLRLPHLGLYPSRRLLRRLLRMRGEIVVRGQGVSAETSRHNKKGPTRVGPAFMRTGPILTTPGGWGLRNPEPKGPGQRTRIFSQCRAAGAGRKS